VPAARADPTMSRWWLTATLLLVILVPGRLDALDVEPWPDRFVFQRVDDRADITIRGTTETATTIEARLLTAADGTPIGPWRAVARPAAAGPWHGQLDDVPSGGWYRLELRTVEASANAENRVETPRFGVGIVIAMIGQSNMVKMFTEIAFPGDQDRGTVEKASPHPLTVCLGYRRPRLAADRIHGYNRGENYLQSPTWGDVTGVGAIRFANRLATTLDLPILLLDYAIDGTSIRQWTDLSWPRWQRFATAVEEVGDLEAVFWHQGFNDARAGMSKAEYMAALDRLDAQILALLPEARRPNMFIAVQNRGDYGYRTLYDDGYDTVRHAQLAWPARHRHAFHAGTTVDLDLATRDFHRGNGHFPASQYEILADRYARALFHALTIPGWEHGVEGGYVTHAEIQGETILVTVGHQHGTRLRLRDPAADVEGFVIHEGDRPLRLGRGLGTARIVGANEVRLTIDPAHVTEVARAARAGTLRLTYLAGQNPFAQQNSELGRRQTGNVLYDDFAYAPGRDGLPINHTPTPIVIEPSP
ncbi:MAG: sialate O-acetylesterase, partial [Acidobacteriota bacterium]